jgi:hypothetical protein
MTWGQRIAFIEASRRWLRSTPQRYRRFRLSFIKKTLDTNEVTMYITIGLYNY